MLKYFGILLLFIFNSMILLSLDLKEYSYLSKQKKAPTQWQAFKNSDNADEFFISLHGFNFDYEEISANPVVRNTESGLMFGLSAQYNTKRSNSLFGAALLQVCKMDDDFVGELPDYNPLKGKTNTTLARLDLTCNYSVDIDNNNLFIVPYLGVSYRIWNRDIAKDASKGYKTDCQWVSIPVGFELRSNLKDFTIGFKTGVSIMVSGKADVDFSRFDSSIPSVTLTPGNKLGYNFNYYFEYTISDIVRLRFEQYFEKYGFNKSVPVTLSAGTVPITVQEPEGKTIICGANVGVVFSIW